MIACWLASLAPCASTRATHALPPRAAPLPPPAARRRRAVRCCASLSVLASNWAVAGDLSTTLFALGQQADALVHANLTEVTPVTYAVVLVRLSRRAPGKAVNAPSQRWLPLTLHAHRVRGC